MIDIKTLQQEIYANKIEKGFNVTDMALEFSLTHEELSEAFHAYRKKLPDVWEELADVMIYLLGMAEILGIDMEKELLQKVEKNRKREYQTIDGVYVRTKESE